MAAGDHGPSMRATAIIPVKRFGRAKQRLLDALDRPQRAAVVKAMLADVLAAVDSVAAIERVIVVTGEGRAERIAVAHARRSATPLEVLQDPDDAGHSKAATLGIIRALHHGAESVALLPGDCPLLDAGELDAALARMTPGRVAVVPDRHGTGTNALLLRPADAIGPAFGEGSAERHRDRAERAGHEVAIEAIASLALDLDTPEDLAALAAALAGRPERAPATATELARLDLGAGG
ncbi:MAG: 2-phospho-L-lactate guanylyltransferase [Solirubrobacterales bacterium]|nr:2-phospho-L-lactate guanylyltransferase [Solirubrobacterales bacterium]